MYRTVRSARLFKVGKGHVILLFSRKQNPDYEKKIQAVLAAFYPLYEKYRYDYKIVIGGSTDEISRKNEYIGYLRNIHRTMPECSVHRVDAQDVAEYNRNEFILKELADISRGAIWTTRACSSTASPC